MSGIYLHIPFCKQACHYCDFHFSTTLHETGKLIDSIKNELIIRKNYLLNETVETIYFGGGTPSLLEVEKIGSLLDVIKSNYEVRSSSEITMEANPDDLSPRKLSELLEAGINRLSIGIQSFSDADLLFMNRAHNAGQALEVVKNARQAGFKNISIDLIYGIPDSLPDQWKKNLDIAFNLDVEHLSCYALTVEQGTALSDMIKKQKVSAVDDEKTAAEFEHLMDRAEKEGYEHYEISNFARDNNYSKHNTSYWQRKKYLGAGPSAHSYDGLSRQWNVSNNRKYIDALSGDNPLFEKEDLSKENKFNEYVLISLRTMWGIDLKVIENEFGLSLMENFSNKIQTYLSEKMMEKRNEKLILTRKGKFYADRIAADLFL